MTGDSGLKCTLWTGRHDYSSRFKKDNMVQTLVKEGRERTGNKNNFEGERRKTRMEERGRTQDDFSLISFIKREFSSLNVIKQK